MMKRLLAGWRDTRGVAALELALLSPLFILMLLGFFEIGQYLRALSIVERTAFSIGNMVAERSSLIDSNSAASSGNIGVYWQAATVTAQPLDMVNNGMVIISVFHDISSNTTPKPALAWSRIPPGWKSAATTQLNPQLNPRPSDFPPFYSQDNTVVVEVSYTFTPFQALTTFLPASTLPSTQLYRRVYYRPRFKDLDVLQPP